jgi:hypothetical protein
MGRRRRKPGDPPDSTHYLSWRPNEAKYWFFGGKWIPPEKIEPRTYTRAENVRPYEKPPTRLKSVGKLLDEAQTELTKVLALYRDLGERGVDALEWDWMKEKIRKGECDPREPNHLHFSLCNAYSNIEKLKGDIPVYEAIIDGLTPGQMPLFVRRRPET